MTTDLILTIPGIADTLQCSTDTAEKLIKTGKVRGTKKTGKWLTLHSLLVDYVRQEIEAEQASAQSA